MDSASEIPILDFRRSSGVKLEEGNEGWKEMSKKVREAFESRGCFLLRCDEISKELCEELFTGMKSLFDLPEETKEKFISPKAYRGYMNKGNNIPHSQSFGIESDLNLDTAHQDFINLMWPQGNPTFSETLSSIYSKTRELSSLILKMVVDGFDLPQQYKLDVEEMGSTNDTRLTRYIHPEENKDIEIALVPHRDLSTISFICESEVQGLQVLSETGNWVDVNIPPNSFVVLCGDMLKAWSNGRFQAVTHRVVTRGDKERFVFVLFTVPNDSKVIKAPSDFVDEENHPLRYRPFKYGEFIHYQYSTQTLSLDRLDDFAGL